MFGIANGTDVRTKSSTVQSLHTCALEYQKKLRFISVLNRIYSKIHTYEQRQSINRSFFIIENCLFQRTFLLHHRWLSIVIVHYTCWGKFFSNRKQNWINRICLAYEKGLFDLRLAYLKSYSMEPLRGMLLMRTIRLRFQNNCHKSMKKHHLLIWYTFFSKSDAAAESSTNTVHYVWANI